MNKEKVIKIVKNVVAIVVIAAMFVIIFYQNRDRDIFKFGKDESSKIVTSNNENNTSVTFSKSSVERVGDNVAFLTPSEFVVMNKKAEGDTVSIAFSTPVLHTNDNYAVIYDKNAKSANVYKNDRLSYSVVTEENIMKAKVNENGYLLIATEKEGYNCECLVYNKSGEAIFKWDISKSEFIDGAVTYSNNKIILSVANADNDKLVGEIMVIDVTNAKTIKKHSYDSQLFYDINIYKNDTYAAFSNASLVYYNSDGEEKWKYDYSGKKLVKADISEPEMMVLAFLPEDSVVQGNSTDVKAVNRLGKVYAEKSFDGSIDDISVTDSSIALACGKKVIITDKNLKEKKTLENDSGIKKIALFKDNKHVFVIGNSESKILK